MRETTQAKALRYLGEGRLQVDGVDEAHVRATCRGGATNVYDLGWTQREGWRCSCHARGECAHLIALRLVVNVEARGAR